jgi:hypothetical protein
VSMMLPPAAPSASRRPNDSISPHAGRPQPPLTQRARGEEDKGTERGGEQPHV